MYFDGKEYKEDSSMMGGSNFNYVDGKWACSTTGMYVGRENSIYKATNTSAMNMTTDLSIYMTARLAPTSLKYYGLCLMKGNYTVQLHFAEIKLTNYGKRIFDIWIQVSDWKV